MLCGAALDTGNLGVGALGTSVLEGVAEHAPGARVTVFDNGWGRRCQVVRTGVGELAFEALGARLTRRIHRPESYHRMSLAASINGRLNQGTRAISAAEAILDVSGGDSFTDMYGAKRFRMVTFPKHITLRLGRPLILLPQTYGPFHDAQTLKTATGLVRRASSVWARDPSSFEVLSDLLGPYFDSARHREGVDMAFGMTSDRPPEERRFDDWLSAAEPLAGINISGLLFDPPPANNDYEQLTIDYREVMAKLLHRLVLSEGVRILLVPHVLGRGAVNPQSDQAATERLMATLDLPPNRVRVVPSTGLTPAQAKWWISQCDWFCGGRMHSTIAALSSGVPAAAIAYSVKTAPVFATVGLEGQVVDGRTESTEAAVARLWASWEARNELRGKLAANLPAVLESAKTQMQTILTSAGLVSVEDRP